MGEGNHTYYLKSFSINIMTLGFIVANFDYFIPVTDCPSFCSLFRQYSEVESRTLFGTIAPTLDMMLQCTSSMFMEDMLQKVSDCIREHPTWTAVHVAAYTGLWECFKHQHMKRLMLLAGFLFKVFYYY